MEDSPGSDDNCSLAFPGTLQQICPLLLRHPMPDAGGMAWWENLGLE